MCCLVYFTVIDGMKAFVMHSQLGGVVRMDDHRLLLSSVVN